MAMEGWPGPRGEARAVEGVLRDFELDPPPSLAWRRRLADLACVLRYDYEDIVAGYVIHGQLPLADVESAAKVVFPGFNREPLSFREAMARVGDLERRLGILLCFSPRRGRGRALRGFCAPQEKGTVVWVNNCHTPAAVATTLAHEIGHVFWQRLQREDGEHDVHLFLNADYSGHLAEPGELFADIFATLAAYPHEAARRLFGQRGWPRSLRELERRARTTVGEAYRYLRQHHEADDLRGTSRLSAPLRFAYLTSMIHFCRVRAAVLHTVGV